MLLKTEFTERPESAVIEKRGDVCDLWVRQHIEEVEKEDGIVFIADEAYMILDEEDCPDIEEVKANIEDWHDLAKEWSEPKQLSPAELQAKIEYLEILVKEK